MILSMEIISIGDVVRLNSGGPRMTVVSAPDTSLPTSAVSVVWTLDSGHTDCLSLQAPEGGQ